MMNKIKKYQYVNYCYILLIIMDIVTKKETYRW